MKVLTAVGLTILVCSGLSAQRRAPALAPQSVVAQKAAPAGVVPSAGALGGAFASGGISRPLGGVALPTFPSPSKKKTTPATATRYIGPIYYVPSYSDLAYQPSGYSSIFNQPASSSYYYPPAQAAPSSSQPIIINQYFTPRSTTTQTEDGSTTTTSEAAGPETAPGDPIGTPSKYYLIAYKDHSIYSALAYWLEGDTLHYVTTQNTHNQASLALIDLDQTTKLNADSSVPFSLAGK